MGVPEGCIDGMSTEVLAGNGERGEVETPIQRV
jgi:hypothetical protein